MKPFSKPFVRVSEILPKFKYLEQLGSSFLVSNDKVTWICLDVDN